MKYDIATKVLMDKAGERILEKFLGIAVEYLEMLEELPQETVSLKRSDYIFRVTTQDGKLVVVIWEFLSTWKRQSVLNLIDYMVRVLLKFPVPVIPVILLLRPSRSARDYFEESGLTFKFRLVKLYEMLAAEFMKEVDVQLLPFVPAMEGGSQAVWEAEKRIYESELPVEDKADLLTAMAIFAGLKSEALARKLVERRRDIMIESAAYDIIKEEGIEEGIQQGILQKAREAVIENLEVRFEVVPGSIVKNINGIDDPSVLKMLHKKAATVDSIEEFKRVMERVLS